MTIPFGLEPQGEATLPQSAKPMLKEVSPGFIHMAPLSYYGYNNSDDAYIFAVANNYLATKYGGGLVRLAPMTFNGKSQATPTWGIQGTGQNNFGNVAVEGCGASTIWLHNSSFTGPAWFAHRNTSYGAQYGQLAQPATGYLRNFVIDGQNAPAGSKGVDYGDGWGLGNMIDLRVVNYFATGSIGAYQNNFLVGSFWTEKNCGIKLALSNNATAMIIDSTGGSPSHEYNEFHISMFAQKDQQGIVVQNGVNMGGSRLLMYGNMSDTSSGTGTPTNNVAMLSFLGANSRWYYGDINVKVEGNGGHGGGTFPWTIFSDGNGYIRQCSGRISTSLNDIKMNGAEFGFQGFIAGNTAGGLLFPTGNAGAGGTSATPPATPASNTWFHNTAVPQSVTISGGTVSSVKVGTPTVNVTIPASAGTWNFNLAPGMYFNVTYSVAPTVVMVPSGAGD